MKKYYVSCTGDSPLARYSKDFYELVLRDKGYQFINNAENHVAILSKIASKDQVHLEIDGSQPKAIHLLYLMLKTRYKHVSVTLHDAPSLHLSFNQPKNPVVNVLSRLYKFIRRPNADDNLLSRISIIYVLSLTHILLVRKRFHVENVCYLPPVMNEREIEKISRYDNERAFFGQEGTENAVAYFKRIHKRLMEHDANALTKKQKEHAGFPFFQKFSWTRTVPDTITTKASANSQLLDDVKNDMYGYLIDNHSGAAVAKFYKD